MPQKTLNVSFCPIEVSHSNPHTEILSPRNDHPFTEKNEAANIRSPENLTFDEQGNLFVVGSGPEHEVFRFSPDGVLTDLTPSPWHFHSFTDIAVDGNALFILDSGGTGLNGRHPSIQVFVIEEASLPSKNTLSSEKLKTTLTFHTGKDRKTKLKHLASLDTWRVGGLNKNFAHPTTHPGHANALPPTALSLDKEKRLFVASPDGFLYVFEPYDRRVLSPYLSFLGKIPLENVVDIAFDSENILYAVVEPKGDNHHHIKKLSLRFERGKIHVERSRSWGLAGRCDGELYTPKGIAIDNQDRIYLTDQGRKNWQVHNKFGHFLSKWKGERLDNGRLSKPKAIAVNQEGEVFVIDTGLNSLLKFTPLEGKISNQDISYRERF